MDNENVENGNMTYIKLWWIQDFANTGKQTRGHAQMCLVVQDLHALKLITRMFNPQIEVLQV